MSGLQWKTTRHAKRQEKTQSEGTIQTSEPDLHMKHILEFLEREFKIMINRLRDERKREQHVRTEG